VCRGQDKSLEARASRAPRGGAVAAAGSPSRRSPGSRASARASAVSLSGQSGQSGDLVAVGTVVDGVGSWVLFGSTGQVLGFRRARGQSGFSEGLGSRVSRSSPAVGVFSWTGGSPVVNRQRQTGGQSQVGQSDGLKDVDRVGDMRQR